MIGSLLDSLATGWIEGSTLHGLLKMTDGCGHVHASMVCCFVYGLCLKDHFGVDDGSLRYY